MWSCRSGRRPRQIHPVAAARCSEDSAVRGCLGSHRRGRLFLLVDGWLRLTQRARELRRACVRAYEGFGCRCEQGLVMGISDMCTLWRGQELAACFRTGSSSQSVAGVGLSVRKRALLIYISTAAPTLCILCGRITGLVVCLGLICKYASWSGWARVGGLERGRAHNRPCSQA